MRKVFFVIILCFFSTAAFAETRSFQLSLVPDVSIHPKTTQIDGLIIGLWTENPQNAFSLGLVNGSTGDSSGLSLGLLANYPENYRGAQIAGFVNYAKGEMRGFQWSVLVQRELEKSAV